MSSSGKEKTGWPAYVPDGKSDPRRDEERRQQGEKTDEKRREKRDKERGEKGKEKEKEKPPKSSSSGSTGWIDPFSMEAPRRGDPRGDWKDPPQGRRY